MSKVPEIPADSILHKLYWRLPPQWRQRGAFAETWRFIMKSQSWSADRLDAHVEEKLVSMVRHAAQHCAFYREQFERLGMSPEDFRSREDLSRLPFIGREELRDHCEAMIPDSQDRDELQYASTGGSSGIPVGFYRHKTRTYAMEHAFVMRSRSWVGIKDTDREIICSGGLRDENGKRALWTRNRKRNNLAFSSDDLTRENFRWMIEMAREFRPHSFRGYASALTAFAGLMLETGDRLPVKAVFSQSETLYEAQRRRVEEAFGVPVSDLYGHSERVVAAAQCERREGYHIFSEYGVLELIDEAGNPVTEEGATGEVVGTTLLHDYFPLIRYRTGDRAVHTNRTCECGRPFPMILRPDGRLQELLVAADGRKISMTSINRHDDLFVAVDQFQFHQKIPGKALLNLIPGPGYNETEECRILDELAEHIGEGMELEVRHVERIEKTAIGKHRFLIQEIED